jgi:hypothetical protein
MENQRGKDSGDPVRNLDLLLETAIDLVAELNRLSESLDENLRKSTDADSIISLLREKKASVDTLRDLAREIKIHLRVNDSGQPRTPVPEGLKVKFAQLMLDLKRLLKEESRIEDLICGRGVPISRRVT